MYRVVVIIPCYKVKHQIIRLLSQIDFSVIYKVIIVDDNCPNKTGLTIKKKIKSKKIDIFILKKNLGVGGATKYGIKKSLKYKPNQIIKMDGDGQHDPKYLNTFIKSQKKNPQSYLKGYRNLLSRNTPKIRLIGNFFITSIIRFITKNYNLKDVVNGFISIPNYVIKIINLKKLSNNFFFEQDLINQISLKKINIIEIKISTIYNKKIESSLNEFKVILPFSLKYIKIFFSRLKI